MAGSLSTNRPAPTPAPAPAPAPAPTGDWFTSQGVTTYYNPQTGGMAWGTPNVSNRLPALAEQAAAQYQRGSPSPTNQTMPVPSGGYAPPGTTVPTGNDQIARSVGGGQMNTGDPLARIEQLQGQYAPTAEGFRQIVAQLQREGYPIVAATHAGGTLESDDAIVLPNGAVYDIISSVGSPNASWSLQHTDNYDPSRQVVTPSGEFQSFSSYLQGAGLPQSTAVPFARPGGGGAGGGSVGNLAGMTGQGGAGGAMAGMDPSYGFIFDEGLKALQHSAAAKGTLLTGPTLKAITQYGQGLASTEYGNIFDRNYRLASLGLNAAGNAANVGTSYMGNLSSLANNQAGNATNILGNQANNTTDLLIGQGNATAAGQIGGANATTGTIGGITSAWQDYLARRAAGQNVPPPGGPAPASGSQPSINWAGWQYNGVPPLKPQTVNGVAGPINVAVPQTTYTPIIPGSNFGG